MYDSVYSLQNVFVSNSFQDSTARKSSLNSGQFDLHRSSLRAHVPRSIVARGKGISAKEQNRTWKGWVVSYFD